MRRTRYAQQLDDLLPPGAFACDVSDAGLGLVERPRTHIELRRWGPPFVPLGFQQDLISGISRQVGRGEFCGLLSLPTGTGKTLTASRAVLDALACSVATTQYALWIAPQRELLFQAAEAVQSAWWGGHGPDSTDVKVVEHSKGFALPERPTCLLMTPIMAKSLLGELKGHMDCVVFDEAHHVAADVFSTVWDALVHEARKRPRLALGLSATPTRSEDSTLRRLRKAFGRVLIVPRSLGDQPLRQLMKTGVLAQPEFHELPGVPGYSKRSSPDDPRAHQQLVLDRSRWDAVVKCLTEHEKGQVVVFALDRLHGQALARHLRFLGAKAEYVDGDTQLAARIGIFERFRNKRTRILVNVALLIEGVDCPAAESVLLTYPVRSVVRLKQMIGRVLRGPAVGGTETCRVWSAEGSQEWLERLLHGTDYTFSGWRLLVLPEEEA